MQNKTIIKLIKLNLKTLIRQCTSVQQDLFRRMYSNRSSESLHLQSINSVINDMDPQKLDHAFTQIEMTIEKNKIKAIDTNIISSASHDDTIVKYAKDNLKHSIGYLMPMQIQYFTNLFKSYQDISLYALIDILNTQELSMAIEYVQAELTNNMNSNY